MSQNNASLLVLAHFLHLWFCKKPIASLNYLTLNKDAKFQ